MAAPTTSEKTGGESKKYASPLNLFAVLIIVLLVLFVLWSNKERLMQPSSSTIGGDTYRAVFLTNGQVYFGKIASADKQFTTMNSVFYLQVKQPLQGEEAEVQPKPELNLVKLGTELHGPTDAMMVNNDQILFIEDLRADSEVVKGIEDYYSKNK